MDWEGVAGIGGIALGATSLGWQVWTWASTHRSATEGRLVVQTGRCEDGMLLQARWRAAAPHTVYDLIVRPRSPKTTLAAQGLVTSHNQPGGLNLNPRKAIKAFGPGQRRLQIEMRPDGADAVASAVLQGSDRPFDPVKVRLEVYDTAAKKTVVRVTRHVRWTPH